jgi:cytochrome c551/c552
MKLLQGRYWVGLAAVLLVGLAACAPNANARLISPNLGEQLYAEESAQEVVVAPTPAPLLYTELTPEQVTAGLPVDFAAALANANPSQGETIALVNGCVGCHNFDPSVAMAGPTWQNLADTAANRRPGESPALYVYESIVNPGAYVVPGYPSGVMPANYQELIPTEDLADLVAYLLEHHQ